MKKLIKSLLEPKYTLILAIFCTVAILVSSLMNPEKLPIKDFNQSDKLLHFSAYFVLTITWYLYYFSRKEWSWVFLKPIVVICLPIIAFGIFIEVLQGTLTTYRTIDSLDALANSIGVSLAFILIVSFKEKLKKVKSQL